MTLLSKLAIPEKKAPLTAGTAVRLSSNIYQVEVAKNYPIYKYAVVIHVTVGSAKKRLAAASSFSNSERKRLHRKLIELLLKENFPGHACTTDFRSLLYATKQLPGIESDPKIFFFPADCQNIVANAVDQIEVSVQKAGLSYQASSNDLGDLPLAQLENKERSFMEYANLALLAPLYNHESNVVIDDDKVAFTLGSGGPFNLQDGTDFKSTCQSDRQASLLLGVSHGFLLAEGTEKVTKGKATVAQLMVSIDSKLSPFFKEVNVAEKINQLQQQRGGITDPRKMLKGLEARAHPSGRALTLGYFRGPANTEGFDGPDGRTTVQQYYKSRYQINLSYPNTPCVEDKRAMYPAELVTILKGQKISTEKLGLALQNEKDALADMRPAQRSQQSGVLARPLLNSDAFAATGIRKRDTPLQVNGRVLSARTVIFGGNEPVKAFWSAYKYSWKSRREPVEHFYDPAPLKDWAIFGLSSYPFDEFQDFKNQFIANAAAFGMAVEKPLLERNVRSHSGRLNEDIDQLFEEAQQAGVRFIVLVSDFMGDHAYLKLCQHRTGILVQEILVKNAKQVYKTATQRNILRTVHKKLGGSQHILAPGNSKILDVDGVLYIGIHLSYAYGRKAALIGVSANISKPLEKTANAKKAAHQRFASFFAMSPAPPSKEPKKGDADETPYEKKLEVIFLDIVKRLRESKRIAGFSRVVLLFRGAPDGELGLQCRMLMGAWRAAMAVVKMPKPVAVHLVVVDKGHNERFFNWENKMDGHVAPGTVISEGIVNPRLTEFYLVPHHVFKGTGKAAKFSLVHEDIPADAPASPSMDELVELCFSLCHLHQIENKPTALPTPLAMAQEAVEHGRLVFNELVRATTLEIVLEADKKLNALQLQY